MKKGEHLQLGGCAHEYGPLLATDLCVLNGPVFKQECALCGQIRLAPKEVYIKRRRALREEEPGSIFDRG